MQHSEKFSALLCEVLDNNLNEKANDHSLGTATHTRGTIAGISPGPRRHSRVGSGRESKNHRFSIKILWKSIDSELRAGWGAAGDRKIIDFQLKTFGKVSILVPRSTPGVSGSFGGLLRGLLGGPEAKYSLIQNYRSGRNCRRLVGISTP